MADDKSARRATPATRASIGRTGSATKPIVASNETRQPGGNEARHQAGDPMRCNSVSGVLMGSRQFSGRSSSSPSRSAGNKPDEARAMLSEIYDWFTEGFEFADLKDAEGVRSTNWRSRKPVEISDNEFGG